MTQKEQIQYLANIYYLAYADGSLEVDEDFLLINIAEGIGASYMETRKALDMITEQNDNFQITLPKRFSDQIRTLEDMMFLAFSDKRLHKMEKAIIMDFAKKINVSKNQLKTIKDQAMERVNQIKD